MAVIINAIKFKTTDDATPRVWRFAQGGQNYENFQCFFGKPQELKAFRHAIVYAISGTVQSGILEATIQLSRPGSDDAWIIERTPHHVRMIKNGILLDQTDVSDTLLGAFLDIDELPSMQAFDFFNLKYDNQQIAAVPFKEDHPGNRRISELIETNQDQLKHRIAAVFHQPLLEDDRVIHTLMKSARPLWDAYREHLRQQRTLLAKTGTVGIPAQADLAKSEREIELMQSINKILAPLVDPANAPKVLKEKLAKVESDLEELLRECQLREVPAQIQSNIPWEKLVGTLTRLVTYQSLVEASDKFLIVVEDKCQKVSGQYIETLESLINSDNHIIAELESCLATLSIQFEDIAEPKSSSLGDIVSKFIKPTPTQDPNKKRDRLENARMAIDYVLARLGELHGSIRAAREEGDGAVEKMRDRHEAFVQEHGKLSKLWQHQVKEFNLPEGMTIKQLLKLISNHGRLGSLRDERNRLREVLQNRRTQMQALEESVKEWRRIAQSQKDSPLDNVALLVAEAQGIVRYLPKKIDALEKYRTQLEEQRSYLAIKHNIDSRKDEVEQNWVKLFNELQIPAVEIGRAEWAEVFSIGNQFIAWDIIRNQARRPAVNGDIFSDKSADAPVIFYSCLAVETSNAQRLALLQAIENHASSNLQLLMTSDPNLRDMLAKLGVSQCRPVVPEELRRKPSSQPTSRAQQIIDLLNQKQP